jgi:hypothetical protein
MNSIRTTHDLIDISALARTVGFEDRPSEFVVWVEWRLPKHDGVGCAICANPENPRPDASGVLVRRDAHVIVKEPTAFADALAASLT